MEADIGSDPQLWFATAPGPPVANLRQQVTHLYSTERGRGWAIERMPLSYGPFAHVEKPGAEELASTFGSMIHVMAAILEERGASVPQSLAVPDEPASAVGLGKGTVITIDGRHYYGSSWRFERYRAAATIFDESWVALLAPPRTDLSLVLTMKYRRMTFTGEPEPTTAG